MNLTVNPLTKIDVIDKVAHLSHGNCVPNMTFLLLSIFDLVAGSRRLQPYEGCRITRGVLHTVIIALITENMFASVENSALAASDLQHYTLSCNGLAIRDL